MLYIRNVPAGDVFVKIDVNTFPVLTLYKERNLKTSHAHIQTDGREIMKSYPFVLSWRFWENYPS